MKRFFAAVCGLGVMISVAFAGSVPIESRAGSDARIPVVGACLSNKSLSPLSLSCSVIALSDEALDPLSVATLPVADAPKGTVVRQVGGPAVSDLSYSEGIMRFTTPADAGERVQLRFAIGLNVLRQYVVDLASHQRPLSVPIGDAALEDGTPAPGSSALPIHLDGAVYNNVLPTRANATPLKILAGSEKLGGRFGKAPFSLYLDNGAGIVEVTQLFQRSTSRASIDLKPDSKAALQALLGQDNEFILTSTDSSENALAVSFRLYQGSNSISIALIDQDGRPLANPGNAVSIALRGQDTGVSAGLKPTADGSVIVLGDLPSDSYSLTIVDPNQRYAGAAFFSLNGKQLMGTISLSVIDLGNTAGPSKLDKQNPTGSTQRRPSQVRVAGAVPDVPRDPRLPSRVRPRRAAEKGFPDAKAQPIQTYGHVMAQAGTENQTVQDVMYFDVPRSARQVKISAEIFSEEFPDYTTNPNNPFDDKWGYDWACGSGSESRSGHVNLSHNTTDTVTFDRVVTIPSGTGANVRCRLGAYVTNVGDGRLPTTVTVRIIDLGTTISLTDARMTEGLFEGKTGLYYIGLPLGPEGTRRPITMRLSYAPVDASIEQALIRVSYNGANLVLDPISSLTDAGPGLKEITFALPLFSATPGTNERATIEARLTGTVNGVAGESDSKTMTLPGNRPSQLIPVFEVRHRYGDIFERYLSRDDEQGGDGWSHVRMLRWLRGPGYMLKFGDVSGEHCWQANGLALGVHREHKDGLDVDARYLDENGSYASAMQGDNDGETIKATLDSAWKEVQAKAENTPNLVKITRWIKANRAFLNEIAGDPDVRKVYTGHLVWHVNALHRGLFANGMAIPDPSLPPDPVTALQPPIGAWADKSAKIISVPSTHQGHFHVSLD